MRNFTSLRSHTIPGTYPSFATLSLGLPLSPRKSFRKTISRPGWPQAIFCRTPRQSISPVLIPHRNEIPEMIASIEPLSAGYPLQDPSDPRHQYMTDLRQRFGGFLHKSSISLSQQGEENTLDAVHALVRSIRTYMLEYGDSRDK